MSRPGFRATLQTHGGDHGVESCSRGNHDFELGRVAPDGTIHAFTGKPARLCRSRFSFETAVPAGGRELRFSARSWRHWSAGAFLVIDAGDRSRPAHVLDCQVNAPTKAGAQTPATGERLSSLATSSSTAQRRPERKLRRQGRMRGTGGRFLGLRSTKAGAQTPATAGAIRALRHPRTSLNEGRSANSGDRRLITT